MSDQSLSNCFVDWLYIVFLMQPLSFMSRIRWPCDVIDVSASCKHFHFHLTFDLIDCHVYVNTSMPRSSQIVNSLNLYWRLLGKPMSEPVVSWFHRGYLRNSLRVWRVLRGECTMSCVVSIFVLIWVPTSVLKYLRLPSYLLQQLTLHLHYTRIIYFVLNSATSNRFTSTIMAPSQPTSSEATAYTSGDIDFILKVLRLSPLKIDVSLQTSSLHIGSNASSLLIYLSISSSLCNI